MELDEKLELAVEACLEDINCDGPLGDGGKERLEALERLSRIRNEKLKNDADIKKLKSDSQKGWFSTVTGAAVGAAGVVVNALIARGILKAEINGTVSSRAFPQVVKGLGDSLKYFRI